MIYFIRHAESVYNSRVKHLKQKYGEQYQDSNQYVAEKFNQQLQDADISPQGISQCELLIPNLNDLEIGLVIVSPLRRALHTCQLLFKNHPLKPKIVVEPLFCERLISTCDIGSGLEQSIKQYPSFDFSKIVDRQAWYLHSLANSEFKRNILQRLQGVQQKQRKIVAQKEALNLMKQVFSLRRVDQKKYKELCNNLLPEHTQQKEILLNYSKTYSKIAVVSHSKCIKRLIGKKISNAQIVAMTLQQLK